MARLLLSPASMTEVKDALGMVKDKVLGWIETLVLMLPNLVAALLVMTLFIVAARLGRRLLSRVLKRVTQREALAHLAVNVVSFTVIIIGLLVSLNILHLEKTVMSVLAGVGVIGLALGFAFQDIASNFMAGILILIRRPLRVGHIVRTNDTFGEVKSITLRNTILRTFSGEEVLLPNKDVFQSALVNYSRTDERRMDLPVGISYGDDLERVRRVTLEAVGDVPGRDPSREAQLYFTGFGNSSIDFELRLWLMDPRQPTYMRARSEAIIAIKRAFDENDITIPFPIRTLDFGIKGGETLAMVAPALATGDGQRRQTGSEGLRRPAAE